MRNTPDVTRNGRASLGLWDDFDRFFENFFDSAPTAYATGRSLKPAYDVEEQDQKFVLSFDLPGMKQEDISIEVHDRVLSISGERKREESNTRHSERFYGRFERQFTLPDNVNAEDVQADYENGVLKVYLGKLEEVKPRKIQIGAKTPVREAKDVQ